MISFLASAKPFAGRAAETQPAAMRSWLAAVPGAEITLYGDSAGAREVCAELGVRHVPDVDGTPEGVPYFSAIVAHAREHARHNVQAYVNCDILLTPAIGDAVRKVAWPQYLLVGQRMDLAQGATLDVSRPGWQREACRLAREGRLALHEPTGSDYFVFRRGAWEGIPPLVIGRAGYDNALIAHCLRRGVPIIDGTLAVAAFHQHHGYEHVPGGAREVWAGADAVRNGRLHGTRRSAPDIGDAGWVLQDGHLVSIPCRGDRLRAAEVRCRFAGGSPCLGLGIRLVWRALTGLRLYRPPAYTLDQVLRAQGILAAGAEESAGAAG